MEGLQESTAAAVERLAHARVALRGALYREAEEACLAALRAEPTNPDALLLLARVLHIAGRPTVAVATVESALANGAGGPEPRALRAELLEELGELAEAEAEWARAEELAPATAPLWGRRAEAARRRGAGEDAARFARRAVEEHPGHPELQFILANALATVGRDDEAREAFAVALELDPRYAERHNVLAMQLHHGRREAQMLEVVRIGLLLRPGDPELEHLHTMLTGVQQPRAADAYVTKHFDRFAETFDATLRDRLEYRTPEVVTGMVVDALGGRTGLRVLDAGCGTGLCGPLLRPLAKELVGVDLSSGMLERARATGSYDTLEVAELTDFLLRHAAAYDVVVAADVLVYFGRLDEVTAAAAAALRPGGLLAFSVEAGDGPPWELRTTGRYAHGADEVRRVCAAAGLEEVALEESDLRLERGEPVRGFVTVQRR